MILQQIYFGSMQVTKVYRNGKLLWSVNDNVGGSLLLRLLLNVAPVPAKAERTAGNSASNQMCNARGRLIYCHHPMANISAVSKMFASAITNNIWARGTMDFRLTQIGNARIAGTELGAGRVKSSSRITASGRRCPADPSAGATDMASRAAVFAGPPQAPEEHRLHAPSNLVVGATQQSADSLASCTSAKSGLIAQGRATLKWLWSNPVQTGNKLHISHVYEATLTDGVLEVR